MGKHLDPGILSTHDRTRPGRHCRECEAQNAADFADIKSLEDLVIFLVDSRTQGRHAAQSIVGKTWDAAKAYYYL